MFFYHEFAMSKENKALPWHWAKNNLLKHEQSHCMTDASAKHPGVSEVREKKRVHVFPAFRLCECSSYMSGILMLVVLNEAQCLSSGSPLVLISFYQPFSGAIHWAAELTFDPKCIKDISLGAAASSPSRHFNWKHIVLLSIHHLPTSRECREDMTIPLAPYSFAKSFVSSLSFSRPLIEILNKRQNRMELHIRFA